MRITTEPLQDVISALENFESPDAPVVSVYWDVAAELGAVRASDTMLNDLAKKVRETAGRDGTSHLVRTSLMNDADRILELRTIEPSLLGRSLAFFSCHARGLERAASAPTGLGNRVEIGARPFLRPLMAVLDEARLYGVAVVDREHGWLYTLHLGELEATQQVDGEVLRTASFAAFDKEHGVHRKAEELAKRHYREIAHALDGMVRDHRVELMVIGGHEETIPAFREELPTDLRSRVVGTFVVDPHTMTAATVRDAARLLVDNYERQEDSRLVQQTLDRVAAGGTAAEGLDWCLHAAVEDAIGLLLVDPAVREEGRECSRCGWIGLDGDTCPIDGRPTGRVPDIVDEIESRVMASGGRVRLIPDGTALGRHGLAALLRFPVSRPVPDRR